MSKKTKRLILAAAAILLILLGVFLLLRSRGTAPVQQEELIRNGRFTEVNSEGVPVSWYTDAYVYDGYTDYDVQDGVAHIVNQYPNDARFAQEVSVSPNSYYCLKGLIKADTVGGLGANLSVADVYSFSDSVYDTHGEWQEVTLYGQTGENQTHLTVFARLGGYGGESQGEAWFRDISLRRLTELPEGVLCLPLFASTPAPQSAPLLDTPAGGWTLALVCALYIAAFVLLIAFIRRKKPLPAIGKEKNSGIIYLTVIVLLGFILRVFIALRVPGYDVDIGCFTVWADQIAAYGPGQFYASGFCDYPPGYLLVLWPLGMLGRLTGGVTAFMVKMPPILSDLILCLILYREARNRGDQRTALAVALFYALNPLVLCTGAAWGQCDGLMTLLILLTVLCALDGKWRAALPVYMLSVLVKPQALMFGPLGLAALILHIRTEWKSPEKKKAMLRDVGPGLLLTLLAALAVILPFKGRQPFGWLLKLYSGTMGEYAYATNNACNLHFLLGRNWGVMEGHIPNALTTLLVWALCAVPALLAYRDQLRDAFQSNAKKPQKRFSREARLGFLLTVVLSLLLLLVPLVCRFAGCYSYPVLSWSAIGFVIAVTAAHLLLSGQMENLPLLGAGMLMGIFTCGTMMHERYLFPVAALLLLSYCIKKDRRILALTLLITLAGFLNVGCVLDRNIRIGGSAGHLNAPEYAIHSDLAFLEYLSAVLTCLAEAGTLYVSLLLSRRDAVPQKLRDDLSRTRHTLQALSLPLPVDEPIPKMKAADWLLMLGVTALYTGLALWNLGATVAPQTAFVSSGFDEQVVVDLGAERDFHLFFYGGIHDYDQEFTLEISPDGENWDDQYALSLPIGDCFKWKPLEVFSQEPHRGRYVRVTAANYKLTLFEIVFKDAATGEPIPASLLSDTENNETAAYLIDEPGSMIGDEPNWYNSMYFDEIYHGRTAYEHLHGMRPYETTHPPLGKVFMSMAVGTFGMTPFGWRFAGAIAGVLMLPGMYLLGKLLIRRKWGGFAAMMLMALDCMHYTQTRIATIDSFVVLFIIWSVYFMLRWFRQALFDRPLWKTLMPLLLSGIFMGLSIASKWTGCYNGVGLAVIFFYGIFRRVRQIRAARKTPEEERTEAQRCAAKEGVKRLLVTVACCFLFFIAIPLLIYYLSYIPYFRYNGGVTVKKVIEAAVGTYFEDGYAGGMLGYHSTPGLGMDHPYYSPWYEWPVIAKPMWYYSSMWNTSGVMTIMALGNPVVWWGGLAGVVGTIYFLIRRHIHTTNGLTASALVWRDDPRYALLLICFFAQYLPWMLVPRGTYIYHYFTSVPFIILCMLLCLDRLSGRHEKGVRVAVIVLLSLALLCFIALFPYASGFSTPRAWVKLVQDICPMPIRF